MVTINFLLKFFYCLHQVVPGYSISHYSVRICINLYTVKNSFPIKDVLKTLTSSGISNHIKMRKDDVLEKQQ